MFNPIRPGLFGCQSPEELTSAKNSKISKIRSFIQTAVTLDLKEIF